MENNRKDNKAAENIVEWLRSQQGKDTIKEGLNRSEQNVSEVLKARQIDVNKLDECITR